MTRAGRLLVGAALLLPTTGACTSQGPDVVARVQRLDAGAPLPDAGNPFRLPPAEPGMCSGRTLAIYGLFASVGDDCRLPESPLAQATIYGLLNMIVGAAPPEIRPAEETGISYCDFLQQGSDRPAVVYLDTERRVVLCPTYCQSAMAWVAQNAPLVLACLDGAIAP